jgi:hypothetical protein
MEIEELWTALTAAGRSTQTAAVLRGIRYSTVLPYGICVGSARLQGFDIRRIDSSRRLSPGIALSGFPGCHVPPTARLTCRWDGISRQNRPVDDGRNHNYNEIHIRIHCSLSIFLEYSLVLPFDLCNNICQCERDTVIWNPHVREAVIYKC